MLARETMTFRDGNGWSWEFDLTFMLSNYRCIWGRGCPDTRLTAAQRPGMLRGRRGDLQRRRRQARQRGSQEDPRTRQAVDRRGRAQLPGGAGARRPDPCGKARFKRESVHTRLYRGACIFHNRVDHPGGAGCALHVAALRRGENPMDWKPRICWQVPLFFDIDKKTKTTMVRAYRTVDWGGEGILDWWCTVQADAFSADQPVYVTMDAELPRVCGAAVYDELVL